VACVGIPPPPTVCSLCVCDGVWSFVRCTICALQLSAARPSVQSFVFTPTLTSRCLCACGVFIPNEHLPTHAFPSGIPSSVVNHDRATCTCEGGWLIVPWVTSSLFDMADRTPSV
jgi:hypothetical protein